jgi:hypothetical protein
MRWLGGEIQFRAGRRLVSDGSIGRQSRLTWLRVCGDLAPGRGISQQGDKWRFFLLFLFVFGFLGKRGEGRGAEENAGGRFKAVQCNMQEEERGTYLEQPSCLLGGERKRRLRAVVSESSLSSRAAVGAGL